MEAEPEGLRPRSMRQWQVLSLELVCPKAPAAAPVAIGALDQTEQGWPAATAQSRQLPPTPWKTTLPAHFFPTDPSGSWARELIALHILPWPPENRCSCESQCPSSSRTGGNFIRGFLRTCSARICVCAHPLHPSEPRGCGLTTAPGQKAPDRAFPLFLGQLVQTSNPGERN